MSFPDPQFVVKSFLENLDTLLGFVQGLMSFFVSCFSCIYLLLCLIAVDVKTDVDGVAKSFDILLQNAVCLILKYGLIRISLLDYDDLAAINVLAAETTNRTAHIIIPHPNLPAISSASFNFAKVVGVAVAKISKAR
ncbi:hypothetical protein F5H01DRAFT_418707 [Linnemannia elongata]|nr:hypothetical protein F5H01DRAFT_418707 [Linnemannia elongata]